jgi:hypothetical protein
MNTLQNHWRNKKLIIPLLISLFIISSIAFVQCKQDSPIIGTWLSQKDQKSKWVFTTDSTKWYYNNELAFTFTYKVSTSSPQCGEEVKTGPNLAFLSLKNVENGRQQCYYINTLNDSTLSLSPFGRSNILFFKKQ